MNEINNIVRVSIAQFSRFITSLLQLQQVNLIEYTVPCDMSIRQALINNNLNFNNIGLLGFINAGIIQSLNFIPKDTTIKLC